MFLRHLGEVALFSLSTTCMQAIIAALDHGTWPTARQLGVGLIAYALAFFYAKLTGIALRTFSTNLAVIWLAQGVAIWLAVGGVFLLAGA